MKILGITIKKAASRLNLLAGELKILVSRLPKGISTVTFAVIIVSIVALPALFSPPFSDEQFLLFLPDFYSENGTINLFRRLVSEIDIYLNLGVFRPFARLVFYIENWFYLRLSLAANVPPYLLGAITSIFSVAGVVYFFKKIISQYLPHKFSSTNLRVKLYFVLSFSSLLVLLRPGQHPFTLFPSLYLGSTIIVLFVCWLLVRIGQSSKKINFYQYLGIFSLGLLTSSYIEIAYLAIPISLIHLLLINSHKLQDLRPSNQKLRKALNAWLVYISGFFTLFIPTRLIISSRCKEFSCYEAAAINYDAASILGGLPERVSAPFSQLAESMAGTISNTYDVSLFIFIVSAILLLVLTYIYMRNRYQELSGDDLSQEDDTNSIIKLIIFSFSLLVIGSLLPALSSGLANVDLGGYPWRDTALTWPGAALLLACVFSLVTKINNSKYIIVLLVLVLVGANLTTLRSNYHTYDKVVSNSRNYIHSQISNSIVYFDMSEYGNYRRCRIIEDLERLSPQTLLSNNNVKKSLNVVAIKHYGINYCDKRMDDER